MHSIPRAETSGATTSGPDEMQGPGQEAPGKDGFGDEPYLISKTAKDQYPIMGDQVMQIAILAKELTPTEARVGDTIAIKAKLQSKYDLLQVTARAYQEGSDAQGYCRLVLSGDFYQGALLHSSAGTGRYDIVLSAKDARGYELQETLGEVKVTARRGFTSS